MNERLQKKSNGNMNQPPGSHDAYIPSADVARGLRLLWRWKFGIGAVTLTFSLAALIFSLLSTRVYEATVLLAVRHSPLQSNGSAPDDVAMMQTLAGTRSVATRVLEELHLLGPEGMSVVSFLQNSLEISSVPGTNLLAVTVTLDSAELAARAANRLAELAIELNTKITSDEIDTTRDLLAAELETAKTRLEEAQSRLLSYQNDARIEIARADVNALISWRDTLIPLLADIEAEGAGIAAAEEKLADYSRVLTLRRSIDTSPAMLEAAQQAGGAGANLLELELREEILDPVYETLERQVVSGRTRLASLEARLQKFDLEISSVGGEAGLLGRLYDAEMTLAGLHSDHNLAQSIHGDLAARYENARLQVASRRSGVQIVDAASVPELPVGRGTVRKVAIAGLIGLLASVLGAFAMEYLATVSKEA